MEWHRVGHDKVTLIFFHFPGQGDLTCLGAKIQQNRKHYCNIFNKDLEIMKKNMRKNILIYIYMKVKEVVSQWVPDSWRLHGL